MITTDAGRESIAAQRRVQSRRRAFKRQQTRVAIQYTNVDEDGRCGFMLLYWKDYIAGGGPGGKGDGRGVFGQCFFSNPKQHRHTHWLTAIGGSFEQKMEEAKKIIEGAA